MLFKISILLGALTSALCCWTSSVRNWWLVAMAVGFFILFTIGYQLLYLLFLLFCTIFMDKKNPPKVRQPFASFVVRETCIAMSTIGGAKLHIENADLMPEGRFVLVQNHKSNFDPIIAIASFPKYPMAFITKPENMKIPICGPFIFRSNFLPIDRDNPRNAIKTIHAAQELITNDIVSIGVYPEGTRNFTDQTLLPFHDGIFMIAQKAKVPLVVMTTKNTEKIVKNFPLRSTKVNVKILKVYSPEEISAMRTAELSAAVRELMENDLKS